MKIKAKYFTNVGVRRFFERDTLEELIAAWRKIRERGNANWGCYTYDGITWYNL